jgi:hypothetical protein
LSEQDVSVQPRFERFPATIKGAFVVHGEDANPHQVVLVQARVASLGAAAGLVVPMAEAVVNVPPHEDMFVPFEFSLTDLDPGWFELECDVAVDGAPRTVTGARRFLVNWPRSTTRRGPIDVGGELGEGSDTADLKQFDCGTDRSTLRYEASAEVALHLTVDGQRLPELSASFEDGRGVVEFYPLLRSQSLLRVEITGGRGREIQLP